MSSTISGNVGGSSFVGASVQLVQLGANPQWTAADASGNYSFTGLTAGTYTVTASFANYTYPRPHQIVADGVSTYGDVNLDPIAVNASDVNTGTIEIY